MLQHVADHPAAEVATLTPSRWKERFAGDPLRSDVDRQPKFQGWARSGKTAVAVLTNDYGAFATSIRSWIWLIAGQERRCLRPVTSFLGVTGKLQVQDGVTHLIADAFWRPKIETSPVEVGSRDFH